MNFLPNDAKNILPTAGLSQFILSPFIFFLAYSPLLSSPPPLLTIFFPFLSPPHSLSSSGSPCCCSITQASYLLLSVDCGDGMSNRLLKRAVACSLRSLLSFQIFPFSLSSPAVVALISLTLAVLPYPSLFVPLTIRS